MADPGTTILHASYSGFDQPERLVVRDASRWASVWATTFAIQTPAPPLPAVDFAREMVVVAALGSRPTGGYDIAIEGVGTEAGGVVVLVAATAPGPDCVTTQALTQPVVLVRVRASEGPVQFHERAVTRSCE